MSNVYYFVSILLALLISPAWAAQENKTEHASRIFSDCQKPNGCEIYAITKDKKRILILKDYPQEPKILWHGNRLAEIRLSCGSPCYNSIFFDLRTDQVSNPIEFVLATDAQRGIVAKADISDIKVMKIFDTQKYLSIKEDFSPAAALVSVIEEAKFTQKGDLYLRYSSGKDYDTKEATIMIDDKTFPILRETRRQKCSEAHDILASNDPARFAEELQKAGYATDPKYADKLKTIMSTYKLGEYDQ